MRAFKVTLAAALLAYLATAAAAAELPLAKIHQPRIAVHHVAVLHRVVLHRPTVHCGYYFGRFGYRFGGNGRFWWGSAFALRDPWS